MKCELDEKHRLFQALCGEMNQLKTELGNKCLDCHKAREASHVAGHEVEQLTCKLNSLNLEMKPVAFDISKFKCEISRLNDLYLKLCTIFGELECRLNELIPQLPALKLSIEGLMKCIDMKSHDLRQKHCDLVNLQIELGKLRDCINKLIHEINWLKQNCANLDHINSDLVKQLGSLEARNAEISVQITSLTEKLAAMEAELMCVKMDNDATKKCNCDL